MDEDNKPGLKTRTLHWCFEHIPFLFSKTDAYRHWREYQQCPVDKEDKLLALVCDVQTPRPDRDSGSMDTVYYMHLLQQLGYKVVFFPFDMRHDGTYTAKLQEIGVQTLFQPLLDSLDDHLEIHGDKYDLVFLNRAQEDPQLVHRVRRLCPNARIIFNTVDLHYLRLKRQAETENSAELREKSERYKEIEFDIMRASDASIVISDVEQALLREEIPEANIVHIPYIREIHTPETDFSERRDIVFIGGFAHPPNVDAIHYFVDEIWPEVSQVIPGIHLLIIGSNMPETVIKLGNLPKIDVLGFVENLTPVLHRCRLSIAPLRFGAGIKGKVGTSLVHGLPCVATPIAAEGMGLTHQTDIMIGEDAEEFAASVIAAYSNEALWANLSENGLSLFEEHYSFASGLKRFRALIEQISDQ